MHRITIARSTNLLKLHTSKTNCRLRDSANPTKGLLTVSTPPKTDSPASLPGRKVRFVNEEASHKPI
jgi:hypothetical protein